METEKYEKKSIKLFTSKNPDWRGLARECVGFANSKGGIIAIGIEDGEINPPANQLIPDGLEELIRKRISELTINVGVDVSIQYSDDNSEWIQVKVLLSSSSIASTTDGQYFIRIADDCKPVMPDELSRLFTDKSSFQWETRVVNKISWQSADEDKLKKFLKEIRLSERTSTFVKQKNDQEILEYYHFIDDNGNLTNLGVLWIGKRDSRSKLSYAPIVQFIKFNHAKEKIRKELWDDFSYNPKELIEEIWFKIPEWKEGVEVSEGIFGRSVLYNYNEDIIRELIANALVHKPYTTRGDIFINMYPDKLEIHNPGLLPLGVTPNNILHQSIKRNEHLSKVFYDLNLMEREGSGYVKIYEVLALEGKQMPLVEEDNDRVIVTIYNQIQNKDILYLIEELKKTYHLSQKEIISLGIIAQHESIFATEFSKSIQSTTDKQIKSWLGNLLDYGIVLTKGKTKGTQYYINPNILKGSPLAVTKLKRIEPHRLKELIITDLESYGESKFTEIHARIGKEIPSTRIRTILNELIDDNLIDIVGSKKFRTYYLK